ncbi:MAG: amidase family protein [Actinomycetota bacterium]
MTAFPSTVTDLLASYRRGDITPPEAVDLTLARIDALEPHLNAVTEIDRKGAKAAATAALERWHMGDVRPLEGVPMTVKDLVAAAGFTTGEGSLTSSQLASLVDSPPAARLRDAGAIIVAKTTTPEFGWKGMTDSPAHGVTRSPWNLDHSPGGSSGGAGATLAAGIAAAAHGNDGGGSIRIPASYCGLVGLKPTFGRVPQAGTSPYVTLSANGALTRSVADTALLLNVMSKPDIRDWHALPYDSRDWRVGINDGLAGLRIGYTDTLGGASTDPEVARICRAVMDRISLDHVPITELGTVVDPLRPQFEDYWKAGFANRLRTIPVERHDDLDPGFRELAEAGLSVGVEAIDTAYAARAQLAIDLRRVHHDVDLLVTPTMPTLAPKASVVYHTAEFDRWEHAVPFTVPFNLTGQPAASIPVGVSASGLPVGLQLIATHQREDLILRAARAILDILEWQWPHPVLAPRINDLMASTPAEG